MTARPRVALVGLGGTIAITGAGPDGVAFGRSAGDLLATVPGLDVDVVRDGRDLTLQVTPAEMSG